MYAATSCSLWLWQIPVMDVMLDQRHYCIHKAFCTVVYLWVLWTEQQPNLKCYSGEFPWVEVCDHIRGKTVTSAASSRVWKCAGTCGFPHPFSSPGWQWWTGGILVIGHIYSGALLLYMYLHFTVLHSLVVGQQREKHFAVTSDVFAHVHHVFWCTPGTQQWDWHVFLHHEMVTWLPGHVCHSLWYIEHTAGLQTCSDIIHIIYYTSKNN